jgi:beta-glucosidase
MIAQSPEVVHFPPGFLWGAATASHQVEGGNRWNDWWDFEQRRLVPHRSGSARQHFERYESDFDLAAALGHNAHRLSLEWSRIEPEQGCFDEAALEHYAEVIAALKRRAIEPVVTLHHFTNPQWFAEAGGWTRRDSVALFRRYAEHAAAKLGKSVRFWLTINEPTVLIKRGYLAGTWPPGRRGNWAQGFRALHHLYRAHTAAYRTLHSVRPDCMVGFANSSPYVAPLDPFRRLDRLAARLRNFVLNDVGFRLLGTTPANVLDFVGINYYNRELVRWRPSGPAMLFGEESRSESGASQQRFSQLGWEIYSEGLTHVLERFAALELPIIVTENGIASDAEAERCEFLDSHLEALAIAVRAGIDVRGYFYWSLYDNFEWAEGFRPHFGLAAIDEKTGERLPRPAASRYKCVCEANAVTLKGSCAERRRAR